jgi:hypothetical protein
MASEIETWMANVHLAVPVAEFVSLEPEDGQNALLAATWQIETGLYRSVSFGNQAFSKPEFVLDMQAKSAEEASEWALALLGFCDDQRGSAALVPGALFAATQAHVDFANFDGWVVGLAVDFSSYGLQLPHLAIYPIYATEVPIFKEVGLARFLERTGQAIHRYDRPVIEKEPQ